METYIDLLKRYYSKPEKWKYKDSGEFDMDVFECNKSDECKHFIITFFEDAKKADNNQLLKDIDNLTEDRQRHIVYTFLLGIALYNECKYVKNLIDKEISIYKEALHNHKNHFAFVWFLICLFHDLAYPIEEKNAANNFCCFDELRNKVKNYELKKLVGVPEYYQGMISKYFDYKRKIYKSHSCDHGICAGVFLYHDMCAIREHLLKVIKAGVKKYWQPDLIAVYQFAASIVSCHNIYIQPKNEDIPKYQHCGMSQLIHEKGERPIRLSDYPTFFLFCLVDTIEPTKRGNNETNFNLECSNNSISFEIPDGLNNGNAIKSNFDSINNWLIDVNQSKNKFTIKL